MRRNPGRRLGLVAAAITALALAAAAVALVARPDPTAGARAATPPSTTATSTTTTSIVVEQLTLPAGTQEYATVLASIDEVAVRGTPPRGWDRSLTPVVSSTDPEPPRSGLDVQRVRLPSEAQPITGRYVARGGWVFTNPTSYQPPQPLVFGVVQRQGTGSRCACPCDPTAPRDGCARVTSRSPRPPGRCRSR